MTYFEMIKIGLKENGQYKGLLKKMELPYSSSSIKELLFLICKSQFV